MSAQPDSFIAPTPMKKRCSKCRKWYPQAERFFYRKQERKSQSGEPRYDSWCKLCRLHQRKNSERYRNESDMAKSKRQARLRARQRAWVRLAQEYPQRMSDLFLQELQDEGWDGDEDLRKGANQRKGNGVYAKVKCRARKRCGWIGSRKINAGNITTLPCPWCGGKVERS